MTDRLRPRFPLVCSLAVMLALTGAAGAETAPQRLAAEDEILSLDHKRTKVQQVLQEIGAVGGLEFIYDEKFDTAAETTLSLSDISVLDALRFVTRVNELFFVVRDPQTVLIAPDVRGKRQEHMPQGTRTFRLQHADPKNVVTVLRSLLQTRQLVVDDRLTAVTMEDTFGQLDIAEEIIEKLDHEAGQPASAAAAEPIWVGQDFNQDMRSKGAAIPRLDVDMTEPVALDLQDAAIRRVYEALGESTGVQFLIDVKIVADAPVSVTVSSRPAQEVLESVTAQLGHFSVVWGPRTVFISPDIDWKRMIEQHIAIQFFELSHAEPRAVITALRSLIQVRQVAEVPRLDAIIMKGNLEEVEAARKIVEEMDRPAEQAAR